MEMFTILDTPISLANSSIKSLNYNDTAKDEVSELYDIFNS